MSSIRPLATIAVLAALGVYLAQQINQGPSVARDDDWAHPAGPETGEPPAWDAGDTAPTAIEVPSIDTGEGDSSLTARSAPDWAEGSEAPAESADFPALPALPEPEASAESSNKPPSIVGGPTEPLPPSATTDEPLTLPRDVPTARYGDSAPKDNDDAGMPSLGSLTTPAASTVPPPSAPGFDVAWEAIQSALANEDLRRAHRMLSQWRDEPGLSPQQRQEVDALLGQLAGTVVYSTEHHLEPAHVVAPGETLATIAQQYDVPWRLLGKINGVATPEAVQPGQTLKVVRGPFSAEVDLDAGQIVLLLDDRYAGRFPVRIDGAAPTEGGWRVGQKRLEETGEPMAGAVVPTAAATAMAPKVVLENPSGQRVELSSAATASPGANGRLQVASNDLADLYDILSVGSEVTIRR